ncbi:DNA cytosine methyltransferase [Pseudomonas sp. TNT11]|uniref:DNA (cytosine-5-)-methyltransferase n=1 Tax=Pseudomonas emilianonis TaxID=2915812 RepID=A0ABT0EKC1_9PSED|nr:DNA cytosine methyltransferase [Pseudomonas emilianonis]
MEITYGSVCSGIEAATQGWHPLGMRAAWFAEIEPFPSAVLAHHYPDVPNHGDMTKLAALVLAGKIPAPDVLVGGTPCQAFSVAGMREGLTDPRGALTIKYVELADAVDYVRAINGKPASVIVWENVPGVLSDKGNAFGCFLGALAGEDCELQPPGKKWQDAGCVYGPKRTIAWRVLDAQYFGLAQRRRRVFVVASARDGFDPAEVLFEREGVRRDTAPRRGEKADAPAGTLRSTDGGSDVDHAVAGHLHSTAFGGGANCEQTEVATALSAHPGGTRMDAETETFIVSAPLTTNPYGDHESRESLLVVVGTLQANGKAAGSATNQDAEQGLLVVHGTQDPGVSDKLAFSLGRNNGQENAVLAFSCKDHGADAGEIAPTLRAMNHSGSHANAGGQVAVCITGDITHTLKADGFDGSEDGTGRGQPIVAAFAENSRAELRYEGGDGGITGALSGGGGKAGQGMPSAQVGSSARRLIPLECERLQGFPDDYTRIPWRGRVLGLCPDGPRYKAIGNSKAVTVVRWIGRRLLQQL